jgi:hypothetical protein
MRTPLQPAKQTVANAAATNVLIRIKKLLYAAKDH